MTESRRAIIVLGAPNDDHGRLSSIAVERCQRALMEYRRRPGCRVLPTGGWGDHFNRTERPHGDYVRQYMTAHGIPEADFLECAESANTIEDAALARPILDRHRITDLVVVTSDFHQERARIIFGREFPERDVTVVASITKLPELELEERRIHERRAIERLV